MFVCDHCNKAYQAKKSLVRHIRERHINDKHYPCAIKTCTSKFIRRNYLIAHLTKVHSVRRCTAKKMAESVPVHFKSSPLRSSLLEDVSDNEDFFNDLSPAKSPYRPILEDISEDENGLFTLIDSLPASSSNDVNNNLLEALLDENDSVVDNDEDNRVNVSAEVHVPGINGNSPSLILDYPDYSSEQINGEINVDEDINHNLNEDIEEEPEVISIGSSDNEEEETLITSINLTLIKTEKFRNGQLNSITRSSSIGYSQNLSENDIKANVQDIFNYVQNEFSEYANYYHETYNHQ